MEKAYRIFDGNAPSKRCVRGAILLTASVVLLIGSSRVLAEENLESGPVAETAAAASATAAPDADSVEAPDISANEAPPEEVVAEADLGDVPAQAYAAKCMGCHTIGGGALSGPDLKASSAWPRNNLWDAVKRMEKNVGPLADEEVDLFTDFILAPDAPARLDEARKMAAMRRAATMEPASAALGQALFLGSERFANGGLSCGACHQAGGRGGNLASSLEDAYERIGEAPLLSTCVSPGFPVMRAIYADSPVTQQEAMHVVKYIESVSGVDQRATTIPLHLAGVIGAAAVMALLGIRHKKTPGGTRARLVAAAHRKQDSGKA